METLRAQFDAVYNSLINGQREQAVEQMIKMGLHEIPEMLDYFSNSLCNRDLALDAAKSYFRITSR